MFKRIFIICVVLLTAFSVGADENEGILPSDFSYMFHLYYDKGQLFADRDFQFKYDIDAVSYDPPAQTTEFPYRGEVINFVGEVAANFIFDPRKGDIHFTTGKLSVRAPYVADGQKVVFYDAQNQPLLTIPVGESSFCNDDGICNADRGEDSRTCPKDCKQALPSAPAVVPTDEPGDSSILVSIIYIILGIVAIVLVWWFFKRRDAGTGMVLPPSPPISGPALPTPPSPPSPGNTV